jgi:hypothetical protein
MNEKDAISSLYGVDESRATKEELQEIITHLKHQFQNRYMYLVGEWSNSHRAKSTRDGKFVKGQEIVEYLNK